MANLISLRGTYSWGGDGSPGWANQTIADGQLFVNVFEHCVIKPCSEIFDTAQVLFCCRCTRYFFKPNFVSKKRVFLTLLLLMGGVESNPGSVSNSSVLNMGVINAR